MLVVMKRKGRMESVLLGLVLLLCRTNGLQLGDGTVGWCGELDVAFMFDGGWFNIFPFFFFFPSFFCRRPGVGAPCLCSGGLLV